MVNRVQAAVLSFGSIAAVIGMFAPWLTIGPTSWSSLDLRSLVVDLGYKESSIFDYAVSAWVLVPALLAVAVFAGWLQRLVTSGVFGVLGALYAGVVAFAVTRAPEIVPFDTEWGVTVTFVGAVVVFVASVWGFVLAATDRRSRHS